MSFFRRYKFRLSEFDLLEKRDKFRASEFVSNEKRKLNNIKQANYFYCLWLPINTMLGGGDQNNRLGMESPVGLMLHCSKLFLPEFVLPVKGTNLDGLNVSCLIKG